MKRTLRELYGAGILFFYFLKWPYFLGFIYLYNHGLNNNPILNALWFYCLFLIFKDFYMLLRKRDSTK
jgi:hypothetical protein